MRWGEELREKEIERKLVMEVKKRGGIAPKWVSPGMAGVPDRLVLLPKGKIAFVELKAPGEEPRPLQKAMMRRIGRLGFPVYVIDRKESIEKMLDEIDGKKCPKKKGEKMLYEIDGKKKGGDAK